VLTNTTSRAITVESCAQNGWLQVGLEGHGYTYQPGRTLIACRPSIRLAPGANRFSVTVLTIYEACVQAGGTSVRSVPACTATGPPPLPAGRYTTTVSMTGLAHVTRTPRGVTVTLLRPAAAKQSPSSGAPACSTCPTHPAYGPTPYRR